MSEFDQLNKDKYRFIIYHGHIHILPICEELEDNDNLYEIQKSDS